MGTAFTHWGAGLSLVGIMAAAGACSLQRQTVTGTVTSAQIAGSNSGAQQANQDLAVAAYAVLYNKCSGCHQAPNLNGGIDYMLDFDADIANGIAVPGDAEDSDLYQEVRDGSMPQTGTISAAEIQTLQDWINNSLGKVPTPVPSPSITPSPQPSPSPSPSMVPLTATFSSISADIFMGPPQCVSCHGPLAQSDGVRLDTYAGASAVVTAGKPAQSTLYNQVSSGAMPPGGPALSAAELQAISDWITAGALNN